MAGSIATLNLVHVGTNDDLPGGYSCRDLRSTVASYGAELVLTAARGRGIPEREIVNIRRRCRV
jgi:hypothetical protein